MSQYQYQSIKDSRVNFVTGAEIFLREIRPPKKGETDGIQLEFVLLGGPTREIQRITITLSLADATAINDFFKDRG